VQDLNILKEQAATETPLFLFECKLASGAVERFSTHAAVIEGEEYRARVLGHNAFELKASIDDGADGASKITLILANADSYCSEIERNVGWKGAQLTVRFLFMDVVTGEPASESRVVFRGVAGDPDETTESTLKLTFTNRLNLQRVLLPEIRIERRCPWRFPSTAEQRQEALSGGARGAYSLFYRCGYSVGLDNGVGNLDAEGRPFTSCDYTRASCEMRGMFDRDANGNETRRFGGIEFVPSSVLVRGYGEKTQHPSSVVENEARYNDFVPLAYGTAWYQPPIVFARNDGNLTHFEVLLGASEIQGVVKVLVNDIEIPQGVAGANMTATGWFNIVSLGRRNGAFNPDFTDGNGKPAGDPYGSMATISVVVPNRINSGQSMPRIQVLLQGIKLERFDENGAFVDSAFTNNPAWVLLDLLRRSGWTIDDIDVASFAKTAEYCDQPIESTDPHGNQITVPRYQCNLVVRRRRSAADIVRGVRNGSALILSYGPDGRLRVRPEASIAVQQSVKPEGSNSTEQLNGGWPAYEFSDGSAPYSGIVRRPDGTPFIRFSSRSGSECVNRYSVEFQDEFNDYQQDSLSLVDIDDAVLTGQEVSASLPALGLPNFDQATRIARLNLDKSVRGNTYVEFATSVRGFGLAPGDVITLTYVKEGFERQPFRITRIAPGLNYATAIISAQIHDDAWYGPGGGQGVAGRRQPSFGVGVPRPLLGKILDSEGRPQFEITETAKESADGSFSVALSVAFAAPAKPGAGIGIPLVSLTPKIETSGGGLRGGQTYYYAVSGVDENGGEGRLSFAVRAETPAGSDENAVSLTNLSFSGNTSSFNVYRGVTPAQLVRIASRVPVASSFRDMGDPVSEVVSPPDENYDHANFYWRLELQPEVTADGWSENTISNSQLNMLPNDFRGAVVSIVSGQGVGQERTVSANDATTLTITPKWDIVPDATSVFVVAEASWRFGALTVQGPAEFEAPNRPNATVHVTGRSANVHDQECAPELSIITRWRIGGAGDGAVDADVPPMPMFGLIPVGQGSVELGGVGFADLTNTRTITAGTFVIWYWDEVSGAAPGVLGTALTESDEVAALSGITVQPGDVLQIGKELVTVAAIDSQGGFTLTRGAFRTTAVAHDAGALVYVLNRRVYVVPFLRDFFGSPASGSFSFPVYLPDVRIAAAELFVTNSKGNSPTRQSPYTHLLDDGIRTLSGGQYTIQVDGALAAQADVAPPLVVDATHAVRDIFAIVRQAPMGGDIRLRLKHDGADYCELTIPAGSFVSNVFNGFGSPPLKADRQLTLDIVDVPRSELSWAGGDLFPGADLTLSIRM
jgi:hypothetical protein